MKLCVQNGAATLSYLIGALLLTTSIPVMFYLSGYIVAKGAVEQVARKVARCLSAVDAGCSAVNEASGSDVETEWYGYAADKTGVMDVMVEKKNYSASMTYREYTPEYTTFLIRTHRPQVSLTSYDVPVYEFKPKLSTGFVWERTVSARFELEGSGFAYFTVPHDGAQYPVFEKDESLDVDSWKAAQLPFFYKEASGGSAIIDSGTEQMFTSGRIPVEDYGEAAKDESIYCTDSYGNPCDAARYAGDGSDLNKWRDTAYISIKAFAKVRSIDTNRTTSVKWGRVPSGAGLFLDVYSPKGELLVTHCLGGRVYSTEIGVDDTWYNLWLRGPNGANGGPSRNAVCPGGDNDHDSIGVPRGGSFEVRAFLKVKQATAPASAEVTIAYYPNNYQLVRAPGITQRIRCKGIEKPSGIVCPTHEDCGMSPEWKLLACSATEGPSKPVATCDLNDSFPLDVSGKPSTYRAAVCDADWTPRNSYVATSEVYDEDGTPYKVSTVACGFEATELSKATVANADGCASAESKTESFDCGEVVYGTINSAQQCLPVATEVEKLRTETKKLNLNQPPSAPRFRPDVQMKMGDSKNEKWTFSLLPEHNGRMIKDKDQIRTIRTKLTSAQIKGFQKNDGSFDQPDIYTLLPQVKSELSNKELGAWEKYAARAAEFVLINPSKTKVLDINGSDVFDNDSVPELYYGQDGIKERFDFNLDCAVDRECPDSFVAYASLEDALRAEASNIVPEAANKQYEFNFTEEHVNTELLSSADFAAVPNFDLNACTPTRTLCHIGGNASEKAISLGLHANMPEECINGEYVNCHVISHGGARPTLSPEITMDHSAARTTGFAELTKVLPYAKLSPDCSYNDLGCATIDITKPTNEMIQVSVGFYYPLEGPLASLTGQDGIYVSTSKQEMLEFAVIGR